MSDRSSIEWTDATWNPIVGCSVVSPGCTNCYAMRQADRVRRMNADPASPYFGLTKIVGAKPVWTGEVHMADDRMLTAPLRWKRPRRIFVCSMGDLFHESVPDAWIDRVFAVMALAPQHTFQVLTKRSKRMREYLSDDDLNNRLSSALGAMLDGKWIWSQPDSLRARIERLTEAFLGEGVDHEENVVYHDDPMPLPNVWLGVSAERQPEADERIPELLATPAAVRFVSAEPLLGPVDLSRFMWPVCGWWRGNYRFYEEAKAAGAETGLARQALVSADAIFLDWIIVGGESGPGARPMHPDWARSIRDQCAAARVSFFFKQWGEFVSVSEVAGPGAHHRFPDGATVRRVGNAAAGRLLDGVEHNAFPEPHAANQPKSAA